jgi:hypothetical protein
METIFEVNPMPYRFPIRLLAAAALFVQAGLAWGAATPQADAASQCRADLDDIRAFLPVNDAGAVDALAERGAAIESALQRARADIARLPGAPEDAAACDAILDTYLRAWRPGHLSVSALAPAGSAVKPAPGAGADPLLPQLKILGQDTLLLVLPSFKDRYRAPLAAMLDRHRATLASHKYWIIDVRSNGGGSDMTYEPLLPWLLDSDYLGYRLEYLATPANIKVQEEICGMTAEPAACRRQMDPAIAAMRAAAPGSFASKPGERVSIERPDRIEPNAPQRVAVLVDRECGSSCDQFALTVKAGFRVKLAGRPTAGVVDVGNLRPHALPSGRTLKYSTTRSVRATELPLDGIGVAPDILLPKPGDEAGREAEVFRVQRWLETGRL